MTEYAEEVAHQKLKLKAEKWYNSVAYMLAQNGYLEIKYNSNLIEREIIATGQKVIVQHADPLEDVIETFNAYQADIKNKGLDND